MKEKNQTVNPENLQKLVETVLTGAGDSDRHAMTLFSIA
jgi:hypothetical protein